MGTRTGFAWAQQLIRVCGHLRLPWTTCSALSKAEQLPPAHPGGFPSANQGELRIVKLLVCLVTLCVFVWKGRHSSPLANSWISKLLPAVGLGFRPAEEQGSLSMVRVPGLFLLRILRHPKESLRIQPRSPARLGGGRSVG